MFRSIAPVAVAVVLLTLVTAPVTFACPAAAADPMASQGQVQRGGEQDLGPAVDPDLR